MEKLDIDISYRNDGSLATDLGSIIEQAKGVVYRAVDTVLVYRNWLLGKRIAEEELKGAARAEYGKETMMQLSAALTAKYGKGFSFVSLYQFLAFFKKFPILNALRTKSGGVLGWYQYRTLLQVENPDAVRWYIDEAEAGTWSGRTLQRNISSQYYERTLLSQSKDAVRAEMVEITKPLQEKLEFIKNPVIAEFLGVKQDTSFTENDLEIDLKTSKITHQDVGQMDMYVRMYDQLKRGEGDNPTLGIVLCSDTDSDIAKYSILHGNEQLFATKYRLCLPSDEELRKEIEVQKQMFIEQHTKD